MNCKKLLYLLAVLFATFAIILPAVVLADDQAPPVVSQSSWGAIKALYRQEAGQSDSASAFGVQKPGVGTMNASYLLQGWKLPFCGSWSISCKYGCNLHTSNDYYAIDWNLPGESDRGALVVAPASGMLVWSGSYGGYGNSVVVKVTENLYYRLAHMGWLAYPNQWRYVYQGQILGTCGSTGSATGPHIHFSVHYPASYAGSGKISGSSVRQEGISGHTTLNYGVYYPSWQYCQSR